MNDIFLLLFILAIVIYWWDMLRTKEVARSAGLKACERASVQFLDDTVVSKKFWLRRNPRGRIQLCRLYLFEFTSDGSKRYQGRIVLLGQKVSEVDMDAYRIS